MPGDDTQLPLQDCVKNPEVAQLQPKRVSNTERHNLT